MSSIFERKKSNSPEEYSSNSSQNKELVTLTIDSWARSKILEENTPLNDQKNCFLFTFF